MIPKYGQALKVEATLQRHLNKLIEWSQKWLLSFNPAKCKVMSIGHKIDTEYEMKIDGKVWNLEKVTEERDFGVCDLKPGNQCKKAASKAMSVLGMIRRQFPQLDVP